MATSLQHDLRISGSLTAGNIRMGRSQVTPNPNAPTPATVTGLNLAGDGDTRVVVTPITILPGSHVVETSVSGVSSDGFTLWLYRTNSTTTGVDWIAVREVTTPGPDDLIVTGAVSAGNIWHGTVDITPEPNTPTMVEITGLALRGTGPVRGQATAHTSVPGRRVVEVSVASLSPSGCQVWIYRTDNTSTRVSVTLWREP